MTKIITGASVSLDGFISGPDESGFELLFDWYGNGDVHLESADPNIPFNVSKASEPIIRESLEIGAIVCGRHLYDVVNGWGGKHTLGVPVVVLTHNPLPDTDWFRFVSGGIAEAVEAARRIAGERDVVLTAGQIGSQGLEAGLVDEVGIDLVPIVLGGGRSFFQSLSGAPYVLDGPTRSIQGDRVTHLRYSVRP